MIKEIDLHGVIVLEAKKRLEVFIKECSKDVREIVVIHGYNNGTAIKDMIRNELKSKRIATINADTNPGKTRILLKK